MSRKSNTATKPQLQGDNWSDMTLQWFEHWCNCELTDAWTQIQWDYMFDTALVHNEVWKGNIKLTGELRTRLERMGIVFTSTVSSNPRANFLCKIQSKHTGSVTKTRTQVEPQVRKQRTTAVKKSKAVASSDVQAQAQVQVWRNQLENTSRSTSARHTQVKDNNNL